MLRVVVFVCLVAFCAGSGHGTAKYKFRKFAELSVMQNCFGKEYVDGFITQMKASSEKCSTQPRLYANDQIDFQNLIDEVRSMALPWGSRRENSEQYFQLRPNHYRSKRHADKVDHTHTTAEKLDQMREKMACMLGNVTCMLRDLDWMKEDKTPNIELWQQEITKAPVSQTLKDDLMHAIEVCQDFSMCISPQRAKSPFMKELGHFISFNKCYEMKEMMACMKSEYSEYMTADGIPNANEILDMGIHLGQHRERPGKLALDTLDRITSGDLIF